jgi:hypothetical protein
MAIKTVMEHKNVIRRDAEELKLSLECFEVGRTQISFHECIEMRTAKPNVQLDQCISYGRSEEDRSHPVTDLASHTVHMLFNERLLFSQENILDARWATGSSFNFVPGPGIILTSITGRVL